MFWNISDSLWKRQECRQMCALSYSHNAIKTARRVLLVIMLYPEHLRNFMNSKISLKIAKFGR